MLGGESRGQVRRVVTGITNFLRLLFILIILRLTLFVGFFIQFGVRKIRLEFPFVESYEKKEYCLSLGALGHGCQRDARKVARIS